MASSSLSPSAGSKSRPFHLPSPKFLETPHRTRRDASPLNWRTKSTLLSTASSEPAHPQPTQQRERPVTQRSVSGAVFSASRRRVPFLSGPVGGSALKGGGHVLAVPSHASRGACCHCRYPQSRNDHAHASHGSILLGHPGQTEYQRRRMWTDESSPTSRSR